MVRVGLIGAGFIGRNHFNQYEKLGEAARVVVLCDPEADRRAGDWSKVGGNLADARGTRRDLGSIRPCSDWHELLTDDTVDMVDICTPTFLHYEMAVAALEAGKHVLCEKPMALTVEQCDEMIAAARSAKRKLMVAQCIRFWPEYVYLKQVVDAGTLGPLRSLQLRRNAGTPTYALNLWNVDATLSGGAVLDLHVHDVDYALYLLGKPDAIHARTYQRANGSADRVHALWHYKGGPIVDVQGAWDLPSGFLFNMGFTAVFDEAALAWDSNTGQPLKLYRPTRDPEVPALPEGDGYLGEITHFVECIEQDRAPTVSTPQESRDAVAIALAEKEAGLADGVVRMR
jgi:predicted dehydrogenase